MLVLQFTLGVIMKKVKKIATQADLEAVIRKTKAAQLIFANYTQEKVDKIFEAAAIAASAERIPLSIVAVEETGMGIVEDKVIKNQFSAEYIYNKYKDKKTCGILKRDFTSGIMKIAEPVGIIAGVIPTTNPTSTAIFKSLIAIKTRNAVIFSPHPRAKKCTSLAVKIVHDAAVATGAPEGILACIDEPTIELTNYLMHHHAISMILATGGPGLVQAAYSSGKPAIGVGAGNVPVVIDESASVKMAVSYILMSKSFDNGVICASEQSVTVVKDIYEDVKKEFAKRGGYILSSKEKEKVGKIIIVDGKLNANIVGQYAWKIAEMAGITVPKETKALIAEVTSNDLEKEPFAREKLSPTLALYKANDYKEAIDNAFHLVDQLGIGHTAVYYTRQHVHQDRIDYFGKKMKTGRILINVPSSQGAIGDVFNFKLAPSLTLGCGTWGGNSVSENIGVKHLINIKTLAGRRENMLWFKVPKKIYFKYGCLEVALGDIKNRKRAFIVTDKALLDLGIPDKVAAVLERHGIETETFFGVKPDPTLDVIERGVEIMNLYKPDMIVAVGGGSPIDAAKMMWTMYEDPNVEFEKLAMRFMDATKRICKFPKLGEKAYFVAIPTTSGTGSEVTPFAVVTDHKTGAKYPLADYSLTPDMAIVDPELVLSMPKGLTAASGIDALVHAIEAYVSIMASDFTNGLALEAIGLVFKYLPVSYAKGSEDFQAREEMHYAATIAGMAFANSFLGICHSMAHKLGAKFHVPHGVANALMISEVIRYNAVDSPTKMPAFSQYKYPQAKERYAKIADYLGFGGKTLEEKIDKLIEKIEKLKAEIGIPASIKEWGVDEKEFLKAVDELALNAFDDQCTGANPRYPLIPELKELYLKAYYGKKSVSPSKKK